MSVSLSGMSFYLLRTMTFIFKTLEAFPSPPRLLEALSTSVPSFRPSQHWSHGVIISALMVSTSHKTELLENRHMVGFVSVLSAQDEAGPRLGREGLRAERTVQGGTSAASRPPQDKSSPGCSSCARIGISHQAGRFLKLLIKKNSCLSQSWHMMNQYYLGGFYLRRCLKKTFLK